MTADVRASARSIDSSEPLEPSFGELVASASRDLSELVRDEITLAKSELRADLKVAAAGGVMFSVSAVFGLFILIMLLIAAAEGLVAAGLFRWAAYLVVAGVLMILAGILSLIGMRTVKRVKPPARTIETTKDTIAWAKHPTREPSMSVSDGSRVADTMPPGHS